MLQASYWANSLTPLHYPEPPGYITTESGGVILIYSFLLTMELNCKVKLYRPESSPFVSFVRLITTVLNALAWYTLE
jgi:hypothetical protein